MTQEEVITRLCALCTEVGAKQFKHALAHDCFCKPDPNFQFEEPVLTFIETAVRQALTTPTAFEKKYGRKKPTRQDLIHCIQQWQNLLCIPEMGEALDSAADSVSHPATFRETVDYTNMLAEAIVATEK